MVFSDDPEPGAFLMFSIKDSNEADLAEPEAVFLHVEDSRTVLPHSRGGGLYTTASRKALDWYRSLNVDQIQEFEARCAGGQAETRD